MLFGPRLKTVFASRWNALFWSLGVLLTAWCTVPAADEARRAPADQAAKAAAAADTAAMVEERREAFERARRLEQAAR